MGITKWILFAFVVQVLSPIWLFVAPWTAACQAPCLSLPPPVCPDLCPLTQWCYKTISTSPTRLLLPSVFPSIKVFSNESEGNIHQTPNEMPTLESNQSPLLPSSDKFGECRNKIPEIVKHRLVYHGRGEALKVQPRRMQSEILQRVCL